MELRCQTCDLALYYVRVLLFATVSGRTVAICHIIQYQYIHASGMRHIIQYQYIYASGSFYNWLFAPEHGGNCNTYLYLGTYLTLLSMT